MASFVIVVVPVISTPPDRLPRRKDQLGLALYRAGMTDLEMRELRFFHAVAEELNFSRAAERLGMAQPPLSRAIRQLERRLGVQLFERNTRQVALTHAGAVLLQEAERLFATMAASVTRTRQAAVPTEQLTITTKPAVATDLLREIVAVFGEVPNAPLVQVVISGYGQQVPMLRDGRADLALLGSPHEEDGLELEPLISEPRVAALPIGHELTRRHGLRCRDLAGLPFPQWTGANATQRAYWAGQDREGTTADSLRRHVAAAGPRVQDASELLEAVALGQAVALIPASLAGRNVRGDIAYRPVHDASPYETMIAWRAGTLSAWGARFVSTAREITVEQAAEASIAAL